MPHPWQALPDGEKVLYEQEARQDPDKYSRGRKNIFADDEGGLIEESAAQPEAPKKLGKKPQNAFVRWLESCREAVFVELHNLETADFILEVQKRYAQANQDVKGPLIAQAASPSLYIAQAASPSLYSAGSLAFAL